MIQLEWPSVYQLDQKKQDGIYFKMLEISKMLLSYGIHFASSKLNFSKYFLKS